MDFNSLPSAKQAAQPIVKKKLAKRIPAAPGKTVVATPIKAK